MTKVKLVSDFHDYYDYMFDLDGYIYERKSINTFVPRQIAFQRLQKLGLNVPRCGSVKDMLDSCIIPSDLLVVYADQFAHRGEGKEIITVSLARQGVCNKNLLSLFASEFIESEERSTSYRYLRIGTTVCWVKYHSDDEWRSNCGSEVEITAIDAPITFPELEPYPLFAIDFVKSTFDRQFYAIDYNTCPGLKGTPIEEQYAAPSVVRKIRLWFDDLLRNTTAGTQPCRCSYSLLGDEMACADIAVKTDPMLFADRYAGRIKETIKSGFTHVLAINEWFKREWNRVKVKRPEQEGRITRPMQWPEHPVIPMPPKVTPDIIRRKAYVCCAIAGDVEHNLDKAKTYCRLAYNLGYIPICPALMFLQ